MGKVEPITYTCPICGWVAKIPFNAEDNAEHAKKHNQKTAREYIRKRKL